jgi:hypothetical protein
MEPGAKGTATRQVRALPKLPFQSVLHLDGHACLLVEAQAVGREHILWWRLNVFMYGIQRIGAVHSLVWL